MIITSPITQAVKFSLDKSTSPERQQQGNTTLIHPRPTDLYFSSSSEKAKRRIVASRAQEINPEHQKHFKLQQAIIAGDVAEAKKQIDSLTRPSLTTGPVFSNASPSSDQSRPEDMPTLSFILTSLLKQPTLPPNYQKTNEIVQIAKYLVQKNKVDLNAPDPRTGCTIWLEVANYQNFKILEPLLQWIVDKTKNKLDVRQRANLDHTSGMGSTALTEALIAENDAYIDFLLKNNASVEQAERFDVEAKPLHLAGTVPIIQKLIERGANLFSLTKTKKTPSLYEGGWTNEQRASMFSMQNLQGKTDRQELKKFESPAKKFLDNAMLNQLGKIAKGQWKQFKQTKLKDYVTPFNKYKNQNPSAYPIDLILTDKNIRNLDGIKNIDMNRMAKEAEHYKENKPAFLVLPNTPIKPVSDKQINIWKSEDDRKARENALKLANNKTDKILLEMTALPSVSQIEKTLNESEQLTHEVKELSASLESINKSQEKTKLDLKNKNEEMNNLQVVIKDLKQKQLQKDTDHKTLQESYNAQVQELATLQQEYKTLTADYSKLQKESEKKAEKLKSYYDKYTALHKDYNTLQNDYALVRGSIPPVKTVKAISTQTDDTVNVKTVATQTNLPPSVSELTRQIFNQMNQQNQRLLTQLAIAQSEAPRRNENNRRKSMTW